ncbi:MAG: ribonucleoside-diphosphate reductase subunit alpha [Proteobacteria bacterium]|nr:ribonucleoside-diphosphate reductase subunit alpha [Pseudomonadota bacterium]
MRVRKRDGSIEPVDVIKITKKVARCGAGLEHINPYLIASKAISGIYDGVTTTELDTLLMQTAAMLIGEEPEYSKLAARLLIDFIDDEIMQLGICYFSDSISVACKVGLVSEKTNEFVQANAAVLNEVIMENRCDFFEYFGLKTIYDRYLLRHPTSRLSLESSQFFFMRVACGLAENLEEACEFYRLISSFAYMPSTPTLFNSGTNHAQMSSCYLLDSPQDSLESIYKRYSDIAMLSKFAGGIGLSFSRVRSRDSLIRSTNGKSHGIIPFIKTLDSSVAAVNQGGKRKGAACVYLETWHADILDFLEIRDNTGDESMRAHNLNFANWVPDLFMKRVAEDSKWSLFDPKDVADLMDLYGEAFEKAYLAYEKRGLAKRTLPARQIYSKMMRTLAQTGNGWMTFKDAANLKGNQTGKGHNTIHLSNLCTEIVEVTSDKETAVCNLGSLNLSRYVKHRSRGFDFVKLGECVRLAIKYLDRVVDINYYPIPSSSVSNKRWRPVGLGVMGLQDVFFKLRLPFDSEKARTLSRNITEHVYFHALSASCELARKLGAHEGFEDTRASQGDLQFDLWGVKPKDSERWDVLKENIKKYGLRNSLTVAVAPTATIASITGVYECIEPQVSNLFKRETLSGEFVQINTYLVRELRKLGLWTKSMKQAIKAQNGSIQHIKEVPDYIKQIYRTAWEIPQKSLIEMAADRGAFIDQSQSLNLFMENPTIGKLSSMYIYAWRCGLKTTYYLRSRGATQIRKTTIDTTGVQQGATSKSSGNAMGSDSDQVSCSLENPDTCEACT